MSRQPPSSVWRVFLIDDNPVAVLARHAKGARTIASMRGLRVDQTRQPTPVPDGARSNCINAREVAQ